MDSLTFALLKFHNVLVTLPFTLTRFLLYVEDSLSVYVPEQLWVSEYLLLWISVPTSGVYLILSPQGKCVPWCYKIPKSIIFRMKIINYLELLMSMINNNHNCYLPRMVSLNAKTIKLR